MSQRSSAPPVKIAPAPQHHFRPKRVVVDQDVAEAIVAGHHGRCPC